MADIAIRVDHIAKQYRIGTAPERYRTLRDTITGAVSTPWRMLRSALGSTEISASENVSHSIWALNDVSFEIPRGRIVGIIGRNGAGKSTLLKILSRVTEPTKGYAEIYGRVGSLLEVGTGFHLELTGRENIYLNGAILGMKRTEIDRKFDEIVAFSEVEQFLDTPVKRYSSGMYLRLAFAVAAHLEPEILLVDEVLAVGDAEFQRRCLGKMSDVAHEGRTVLFVSHNMSAVLRLTEETLVFDRGRMVHRSPTPEAVDYYMEAGFSDQGEHIWQPEDVPAASAPFHPTALRVRDHSGRVADTLRSTEPFNIEVEYQLDSAISGLRVGLYLLTMRGEFVFTSFDTDDTGKFEQYSTRQTGKYISRCTIPGNLLNEGRYIVAMNASSYRIKRYFQDDQALAFTIDGIGAPGKHWPEPRLGPLRPALDWDIIKCD
jgi:lipopolysaccharide transport system ATP-binding protein